MKAFHRSLASFLAVAVTTSCVSLLPVRALETESSKLMTTQESVSMESVEFTPPEAATTETSVPMPEATAPTESNDLPESGDLTEMLSENATYNIWDMDDLVAALGAGNVSVLTGSRIRLNSNITYPADSVVIVTFKSGTYSIDFNGHTLRGKVGFYFEGGSVTFSDSSSGVSGGIISDAIEVNDTYFTALNLFRVEGGSLTISSGTYIAVSIVIRAQTGSLRIDGGTFLAIGVGTFTSSAAAVIYAGMSEARISSGYFYGYRFTILVSKDTSDNNAASIPNPLKISGGYFDSEYRAIEYIDYMTDVIPDMDDLLATS